MTKEFRGHPNESSKQDRLTQLNSKRDELMFFKKENADLQVQNQIDEVDRQIRKLEES